MNPKQEGCAYPFKELAGVGVAFKLCCELIRRSGKKISIESLLKIAAIGTVADVAPLIGENRVIVRLGLDGLADTRNLGLRALLRRAGLEGRPLRAPNCLHRHVTPQCQPAQGVRRGPDCAEK